MADSQAIDLEEQFPSETPSGRDAQLALLMAAGWRDEIEQAVNRIKKSVNRSQLDRWFRKQWYRAEARRKKEYGDHRANRRQISEHGGDENGGKNRGCSQPFGAAHRSDWTDAVLRRPAASAVQEREGSTRTRGFRQRAGQEDV